MKDYFNLENRINEMFNTVDELNLLFHSKYGDEMSEGVTNMILGIMEMHKARFMLLEEEFCRYFELNEFCNDPETLKYRKEVLGQMIDKFNEVNFPVEEKKKPAKMKAKKK